MATANAFFFNQTSATAYIIINNGAQFTVTGTSDSAKWVAQSSTQTYQSPGNTPGNLNQGANTLLITLNNNQTYRYNVNIPTGNPGSLQVHLLYADQSQTIASLVVLAEGTPLTPETSVIFAVSIPLAVEAVEEIREVEEVG